MKIIKEKLYFKSIITNIIESQIKKHFDYISSEIKDYSELAEQKNIVVCENLEKQVQSLKCEVYDKINELSETANKIEERNQEIQNAIQVMDHRVDSNYWAFRAWRIRTTPLPILSFETHLADHCNLNCIGCDHFSPLAEEKFTDIKVFSRDFERLSYLLNGEAGEIHLLGGEPLLHPEVSEFCKVARKNFPYAGIDIITNGILLPKMNKEFWRILNAERIKISVTKYPINLDYKNIINLAEKNGVEISFMNDVARTMVHNKCDLKGLQDPRDSFIDCWRANKCIFLSDGKLFPCTFAGNIEHFNDFFSASVKVSDKDFIDIYKAESAEEILTFLSNPIPFCRYCDIGHVETGIKWKVSDRKIEEWT